MLHHLYNLKIIKIVNKHSYFSLLTPLPCVDMIKDTLLRQLREKSLSNNLFSDLFWTKDELKTQPASCIWTFHSTFHFLYSCSRKAPHILDALRQTGRSNALMSGCCHRAEGWPPSPSYLWAFLYRLLRSGAELSSAKVLMGWGHLHTVVAECFLTLHTQTITEEGEGATPAHSEQASRLLMELQWK